MTRVTKITHNLKMFGHNLNDRDEHAVDTMGFSDQNQRIVKQMNLALFICGEACYAKREICVLNHSQTGILCLGEEDKTLKNTQGVTNTKHSS
jgi:hypothetical protein